MHFEFIVYFIITFISNSLYCGQVERGIRFRLTISYKWFETLFSSF